MRRPRRGNERLTVGRRGVEDKDIKDRARNGGRDMAALVRHMAEDSLVGWAWSPGAGRAPAPGTQAEFGALVRAWAAAGGDCRPP